VSARILTLVFDFYDQKRFGAPRIMAVVLADEADDRGGGIFQSVKDLSTKTEQKERGVRAQLRRLQDSGLVECVQQSAGGVGNYNEYRLNLSLLVAEITRHQEQAQPCTRNRVSTPTIVLLLKSYSSKMTLHAGLVRGLKTGGWRNGC